jgi:hypothetical protein
MYLKNIELFMSFDSGYKDPFRNSFNLEANFINDYISRNVRALKLETDGTYNMIHVEPSVDGIGSFSIKGEKSLNVKVKFNKDYYLSQNDNQRNDYCLDLLYQGYKIVTKFKAIDIGELLEISDEFKSKEFTNNWRFKKKRFKDYNLDVELICEFSKSSFKLRIIVVDTIKEKTLLNNILIKTLPDRVCFMPLFKEIIIDNDKLIITEFQNRPKFIFKLNDIFEKKFIYDIAEVGLAYKRLE